MSYLNQGYEWYNFSWAGSQNYGRGLAAPPLAALLSVGDLVEVQANEVTSPYNGIWPVVSLSDDAGRVEYEGRLVGIPVFTTEAASGKVRLFEKKKTNMPWIMAAGAAGLGLLAFGFLRKKKK
jgi:LPXTG-motif cell wall-anchored protein